MPSRAEASLEMKAKALAPCLRAALPVGGCRFEGRFNEVKIGEIATRIYVCDVCITCGRSTGMTDLDPTDPVKVLPNVQRPADEMASIEAAYEACRQCYVGPGPCHTPEYLEARHRYHQVLVKHGMLRPTLSERL